MSGEMFPIVAVESIACGEANRLLTAWGHPLGQCHRPFLMDCHALIVNGVAAALTVSASTVSATVDRYERSQVVELARIARSPIHEWAMRPMLRIWRAVLARTWASWPVVAAISYAIPGRLGDIYRFDGWRRVGLVRRSGGGGTWSNRPAVNDLAGEKTLWIFDYEPAVQS